MHDYLDSLSPEQVRGLGGTRDRLAILGESDVADWLQPDGTDGTAIDLLSSVRAGDVVVFCLDTRFRSACQPTPTTTACNDSLTRA